MTYIDYINQFWRRHLSEAFTANEVYLYFFLLKECNSREWQNPFECSNRLIVLSTGISEPTIIDVRNRLQQKGLIEFEPGKRNAKSPTYYLNDLSKPLSNPFSKTESKPLSKKANINIRYKKEDNKTIDNSNELFPEPKKKTPSRKKEIIAPSLSEVKEYFSGKIDNWEQEAETFYYHFDSLGWRTANGALIKRWDSRANLWITEKLMKYGNRNTKNNDGHTITVTDTNQTKQSKSADSIAADLATFIDSIPIG